MDPRPHNPDANPPVEDESEAAIDDQWMGDELEREYQRALEAVEAVDWPTPELLPQEIGENAVVEGELEDDPIPVAPAAGGDEQPAAVADDPPAAGSRVTPVQIIEAALFVGGGPLTAKKLCAVLRDEFEIPFVEAAVDELNRRYLSQERPYEIRLGEGGYRMGLRAEFEALRRRVYGLGPKEVKLSQDALEVLSLVAYRQPITAEEIEELGKPNPGGVLRQLLRRELIAIERGESRKDVKYHTTPRFLELFGLGELDELPQADELNFK